MCRALLSVNGALLSVNGALLSVNGALLSVNGALLSVYWALFSRELVVELHRWKCIDVKGTFEGIWGSFW